MAKTPTQPGTSAARAAQAKAAVDPANGTALQGTEGRRQEPSPFAQLPRAGSTAGWGGPRASYYWIIGTTVALTLIGRMTVLSASTAETISEGKDPYELFIQESQFAVGRSDPDVHPFLHPTARAAKARLAAL